MSLTSKYYLLGDTEGDILGPRLQVGFHVLLQALTHVSFFWNN